MSQFFPELHLNRVLNLSKNGQLSDAFNEATKLAKKYPETFTVWKILGLLSVQIGKLDKAIEAFKKCVLLQPNYADAYINIAAAYRAQGKLDDTINAYREFLTLNPENADVYINIGNALQDQFKFDQAISSYNNAISLKPTLHKHFTI